MGITTRVDPERVLADATELAKSLAEGPTLAHAMTKQCLHDEWSMDLNAAIDHEAEMQALTMRAEDFERAYRAFAAKKKPVFEGN